jgi:hypothetical protein
MVWQSYDHQNIILDVSKAGQLSRYLENKETQLSAKIINVILKLEGFPAIDGDSFVTLHLNQAVDEFEKRVNWAKDSPQNLEKNKWKTASKQINDALWNYVEVLEGCAVELFQQLDQMSFEQWNDDAVRTITYIKEELTNRMDDLIWIVQRLEQQLKSYQAICEGNVKSFSWNKVFPFLFRPLDRALIPNIRKCNKYLNFQYQKFIERYMGYGQLAEASRQSINNFYQYPVLSSMEVGQQEKLKELYFLLDLWRNNSKSRVLPRTEPVRALRGCMSFENVVSLFKEYFQLIREAIFDKSRLIKRQLGLMFIEQESKQALVNNLGNYQIELKTLNDLIADYRNFHLQTDPGSKNWFAKLFKSNGGKEFAKQFNELDKLTKDVENLNAIGSNFQTSLESRIQVGNNIPTEVQNEIDKHLHEMSQPLASKDLMYRHAKGLVQSLQSLDEISSFNPNIVDFICLTLCKAMCADWKYHVLQGIPAFHELYNIHQGIFNISSDRLHSNRYYKFQRILKQLEMWMKNGETLKRSQDIDLDINDIKAYLQDFLAFVQRLAPEEEGILENDRFDRPISKAAHALLQYLYLFGNFFSQFSLDDPEYRLIRKQLLFVDQYFETIDRRIQELNKV